MKNQRRTALLAALSILLVLSFGFEMIGGILETVEVHAVSSNNATVSGYEAQIKELEQQEEELKKKIEEYEKNTSDAMKLKMSLDEKLSLTYQKITTTQSLVSELKAQIEKTEADIAVMQADLDEREAIFKERLRLAHEDRNVSYLAMLFDADGLVEFFNNIERIGSLLDYDNKLMKKYNESKMELETTRARLNEQVNKQLEYEAELDADKKLLIKQQEEVDALMASMLLEQDELRDQLEQVKRDEEALEKELADYIKKLQEAENKEYMVKGQLLWPVKSGTRGYNKITSRFGHRDLTVNGNDVSKHKGIDIGVSYVNIYASGVGKVITSTYSSPYGYYIIIDHGGGVATLYAHLSELKVVKNQQVDAGDLIGVSGNTGWSTGAHLHFELRLNGDRVDPLNTKDKNGRYYVSRPSNLIYYD